MKLVALLILLLCLCSQINCFAILSCTAEIFDVFSSGWSSTEVITTTPQCSSCDDCECSDGPVEAGEGQPGTADNGPCGALGSWPTNPCNGFNKARWTLSDNIITSSVGISTNEQTLIGDTNMNPPGYFDTNLPSSGLYAIKISTTGTDDDYMGFVFVSITLDFCRNGTKSHSKLGI